MNHKAATVGRGAFAAEINAMLRRLVKIAIGNLTGGEARCAACNATYSKAKPFIEGYSGILLCRKCILQEYTRPFATNADAAERTLPTQAVHQDTNPYAPPLRHGNSTCGMCGAPKIENELEAIGKSTKICWACVENSMKLLESHHVDEP